MLADPSFAAHAAAALSPGIRSFIGVPVVLADGTLFGTLCAVDPEPRSLTPAQADLLVVLARVLVTYLERDRPADALRETNARLDRRVEERTRDLGVATKWLASELDARKRTEAALRASAEQFRTVFASAPLGMALVGADRVLLRTNRALRDMMGYTEAELVGVDPLIFMHPDDAGVTEPLFAELVAGERESYQAEKRYVRKDGEARWVRLTVSAVRDVEGRFLHSVSMIEDVTERKRVEEQRHRHVRQAALRAEVVDALAAGGGVRTILQRCAQALVDHLDAALSRLWMLDAPGQVLEMQASAGLSTRLDGPHGRVPLDRSDIVQIARERRPHLTNALADDPWVSDKEWVAREGLVAFAGYPLLVDDRLVGLLALFARQPLADDTLDALGAVATAIAQGLERKAAEAALAASEARFRGAFDDAAIGMALVSLDGRLLRVNPALCALVGYAAHELQATTVEALTHPDDLGADLDLVRRVLAGEIDTFQLEKRYLHKGGHVVWGALSVSLLRDGAGQPLHFIAQIQDITARKATESALMASEARFRALVQHSADVIAVVDADGRVRYTSPAVEAVLGYPPGARLGNRFFDLLHPDDLPRVRLRFADLLRCPGATVKEEVQLRHADGSWRTVEVTVTNLLDEPSVGGIIVNYRDISERRAFEDQLHHQATHDPLTDLPNRTSFLEHLQHALAPRHRPWGDVAVLFLDLDRFKVVNDSLGHEAGDRLLVAVAERLRGCVRRHDLVARFGGDEFMILLRRVAEVGEVTALAERVITALEAPFALEGRQLVAGASIGVVVRPPDGAPAADLLRDVDVAMYQAKAAGRDRYAVFDASMSAAALARLELEADLRRALERDELRVYYQPKVELATGRIVGCEALVRWEHPARGLLLPAEFIPVAEETGLIRAVGRWALAEASRQACAWQEACPQGAAPRVSVNLSASEFQDPQLVEELTALLRDCRLPAGGLELEITETVLMADAAVAGATLGTLKALGVRLAIDDFGTGYSSLAYLKRFPVDALKIDRSFVAGLGRDPADTALVGAVVTLGHALGLQVVAEGVATADQAARLRALGCDQGQGYHFARPLPAGEMEALLCTGRAGDLMAPAGEVARA